MTRITSLEILSFLMLLSPHLKSENVCLLTWSSGVKGLMKSNGRFDETMSSWIIQDVLDVYHLRGSF